MCRALPGACLAILLCTGAVQAQQASDDEAGSSVAEAGDAGPAENPITRFEARIEFEQLLSDQEYGLAADLGTTMLELTEQEFGPTSREAAEATQMLADAQRLAGRHEEAEASYLKAIDIYRDADGAFAESLINPTVGLGDNYRDDEQYLNAVASYNEARAIQRRVYGLLSEQQLMLYDRMSDSFEEMGMHTEANEQQLNALTLVERNYAPGSIEVLEAIYKYAAWLRSTYRFTEERIQYDSAIRIIRDQYGKDSPLLARPYREIGNSFRSQAFKESRGISALNSALELLEDQPEIDQRELALTLRDIGDWRTAFGTVDAGSEEYLRCWEALGFVEDGEQLREEWFGSRRPTYVLAAPLNDRGLSREPDAPKGRVVVRFDIDVLGRPEDVKVIESEPPGLKDDSAERAIRQSRFRPQIRDGNFVVARNFGVEFNYRYVPPEEDEKSK